MVKKNYREHQIFILFLLSLTALRLIYISVIPLVPQEAYYWYYSLHPDLSYFDHPPMVAYSVWIGTHLFGNTIFGIKVMAVIWSALTNIFLYLTMLNVRPWTAGGDRKNYALAAVFLYNLTIFAHLYAVTMVPDTPLIFFWLVVIFFIQRFINDGRPQDLYLAGLTLGFALLSKYTAIAILPAILLIFIIDPSLRGWLIKPQPYLALILSSLVFMPVLIWNSNHDWVSLKFQFADRSQELKTIQTKYVFQLIASQLFLLTPLPLILFLRTIKRILNDWKEKTAARYFFITGVFIIAGFSILSLKTLIKMNWLLPGYTGMILCAVLLFYRENLLQSRWYKTAVAVSLILVLVAYAILLIPNIPLGDGNTWSGWKQSAARLAEIQSEKGGTEKVFIFANSYKTASLLKFYLSDDQPVYAQNIYNQPALQFDVWGLPSYLKGRDALFVFTDRHEYHPDLETVSRYFDTLTLLGEDTYYFSGDIKTRTIYIYDARNYKGRQMVTD